MPILQAKLVGEMSVLILVLDLRPSTLIMWIRIVFTALVCFFFRYGNLTMINMVVNNLCLSLPDSHYKYIIFHWVCLTHFITFHISNSSVDWNSGPSAN